MKLIKFENEKKYIRDFVKLPKILYSSNENMENPDTMKKILLGKHPLSNYFKLDKFLILDDKDKAIGRFCITTYEDDNAAYLGFFECIKDKETAKFLFDKADEFCKEHHYEKIQGPVDASFWIKYRLKINKFETPYTGEPYNKDYYFDLFKENGYEVKEHYTSNVFRSIDETYVNEIFEERFKAFTANGYEIRSLREGEFDKAIDDVYRLLMVLYSDFPIFKNVGIEDFRKVFMSYEQIMDISMTKLAYFKGEVVGFYISIPDYGNLVYHTSNPFNIIRIIKAKKKPKRFIMLYMGVDQQHKGLGKALVYAIMKELKVNGLPSISALIRDDRINQKYAREDITDIYEYVLLEKKLR